MLSFTQLAGTLVSSVRDLSTVAKGEAKFNDRELEQRLDVVKQVMSLGFTMPSNMALSMH